MADKIAATEVAEVLRRAARGEVAVQLAGPLTWEQVYAGNCEFLIDGWRVTFFNDCLDLDYTDSVTSPDGRTADFDDFCAELGDITCPLNLLDGEDYTALERLVETVTVGVLPSSNDQPKEQK